MISLGIESTAHTFGIGIVSDEGKILANIKDIYRPKAGWGIIPREAAEHHKNIAETILEQSLKKSDLTLKDIDIVSFSQGPGLPPCLHEGLNFAKKISSEFDKPLVPVNHCVAHIEIARLFTNLRDPVVLYVSGGNTQVISFVSGRYRIFGETQDIGVGNALDKFGREAGMQFPCGPKIEELAKKGSWLDLPYVVKGMDLSFSGIVTEALKKLKKGERLSDLCFSLQEVFFSMLTEVTERALAHTQKKEVILTGGVAANKRLAKMLEIMCKERGAEFAACPMEYSGDNGANIAWAGILACKSSEKNSRKKDFKTEPFQRTDDAKIPWIENEMMNIKKRSNYL